MPVILNTQEEIDLYIFEDMDKKMKWLKDNHPEFEIVSMIAKGSMNYGMMVFTEKYQSDVDVEIIIMPSLDDIIRGNKMIATTYIMEDNSHINVRDIRLFKELLFKQNLAYLELLHSEYYIDQPDYKELMSNLRDMSDEIDLIDPLRFFKGLKGMMYEKQKALTYPYPVQKDEIEKYGYAAKQLHHIVRLKYIADLMICLNCKYKKCLKFDECVSDILIQLKIHHFDKDDMLFEANKAVERTVKQIDTYIQNHIFTIQEYTINKANELIYDAIKKSVLR